MDALMYGMMPRAKTESLSSASPGEHVHKAEETTRLGRHEGGQGVAVHAGSRNMDADAVYGEERESHQDPALQLGNSSDVLETTHCCSYLHVAALSLYLLYGLWPMPYAP